MVTSGSACSPLKTRGALRQETVVTIWSRGLAMVGNPEGRQYPQPLDTTHVQWLAEGSPTWHSPGPLPQRPDEATHQAVLRAVLVTLVRGAPSRCPTTLHSGWDGTFTLQTTPSRREEAPQQTLCPGTQHGGYRWRSMRRCAQNSAHIHSLGTQLAALALLSRRCRTQTA